MENEQAFFFTPIAYCKYIFHFSVKRYFLFVAVGTHGNEK